MRTRESRPHRMLKRRAVIAIAVIFGALATSLLLGIFALIALLASGPAAGP